MRVAELMPSLALIANERCGSWYIDQTQKKSYSAYFKSTDGHMHIWDFNLRRNNLHLIPIIASHQGCIIVDSTRKGKRIPDALSKTIPIWCCTVNRTVDRYRQLHGMVSTTDWDTCFHSLPSAVSRSEHAQIEHKITSFVDKLMNSGIDIGAISNHLTQPLRPIWFTPQSYESLILSPPTFEDSPFWPVICLSASEAVDYGYQMRNGYLYVQGSGDDQEAWSYGLTPSMFWRNQEDILSDISGCEQRVKSLVQSSKNHLAVSVDDKNYAIISPTHLAIGNLSSAAYPECWKSFDVLINCSPENRDSDEHVNEKSYLHVPIPEGKKGQIAFASSKDYSVGILLSILVRYYDANGILTVTDHIRVDKAFIQHQLIRIISAWEKASPSRVTLKRVNTHFMSHSLK
ncbi:tRNA A64-2'-O-ribosylphosphate transferase [Pilobolus umbonatus]|nr:tRNA A64-2'-O-ribosylphosphate transferase [Pilobolus umbonatus]